MRKAFLIGCFLMATFGFAIVMIWANKLRLGTNQDSVKGWIEKTQQWIASLPAPKKGYKKSSSSKLGTERVTIKSQAGLENFIADFQQEAAKKPLEVEAQHAKITRLPNAVGKWKLLKVANFRSNKLITLPKTVSQWGEVFLIELAENEFTTFPEVVLDLPQKKCVVDLSFNPIQSFPQRLIQGVKKGHYKISPIEYCLPSEDALTIVLNNEAYDILEAAVQAQPVGTTDPAKNVEAGSK